MEAGTVLETVARTIARYRMFKPGDRVAVAVSGGPDSVCLLHVLIELAPRWALRLSVVHFDHRLRGESSRADADFVAGLAEGLGLPFRLGSADVAALARTNRENLEQAARKARRELFLQLLRAGEADRVALGHTRSDQAETVLFRLLRGAGATGLAAIWPVTAEGFVRPLIEVSRSQVEQYLRERRLPWRLDDSNLDLRWARNRIRHELLPLLRSGWNPAIEELLAQTAVLAREEEQYWAEECNRLAAGLLQRDSEGAWLAPVAPLRALPLAAARRLIRKAIEQVKGDLRGVDFEHIDAVLRLVLECQSSGRVLAPGVDVCRSFEWIRFGAPGGTEASAQFSIPVHVPGCYQIPSSGWQIEVRKRWASNGGLEPSGACALLDWERLPGPLMLRNWRPGDRYQPAGRHSPLKLKELFQRARIPLWERAKWPMMVSGSEIVWAGRFGPAAPYAAQPGSRAVLEIRAIEGAAKTEQMPPRAASN